MSGSSSTRAPRRLALAKGARFTCRQCGDCCRSFPVALSSEEADRYAQRDWSQVLGRPVEGAFEVATHGGRTGAFLRRRADGACLFLGPDDLCEVHRHLGEAEKPLACRAFPFHVVPGPRPCLSATFACSSVAQGDGEPVAARRGALEALADELIARGGARAPRAEPIAFTARRSYARAGVEALLDRMSQELEDAGRPFPERLLAVLKFVSLVASSDLPTLDGPTEGKLVQTFALGTSEQVKRGLIGPRLGPAPLPERLLFRQVLALTVRRDPPTLLTAGFVRRSVRRLGDVLAGLAFVAGGGGLVPVDRRVRVNVLDVRRRAPAADPSSPEADGALTRYFVGHLSAHTLLDPEFEVDALLPAIGLLARQYPLVLLLARAACLSRGGDAVAREDYASALRTVDWNFGRVPWTRGATGGLRARLLSDVEAAFAHVSWCAARP